jgi:ATP-dependent DNA helicase RecQ
LQPRSRELLTGGKTFLARKARKTQAAVNASRSGKKAGASEAELDADGEALYEELRRWRGAEAARKKVPPYVVFGNRTLRAIAAARPLTDMDLLEVSGVGDAKLKRYGRSILELVAQE